MLLSKMRGRGLENVEDCGQSIFRQEGEMWFGLLHLETTFS